MASKTRMLPTERIGLIALAIILALCAIIPLARSCSRPPETPLSPNPELVDSVNKPCSDTTAIHKDTAGKKSTSGKPKQSKRKQKESAPRPQRHHLNEVVN